MQRVRIQYTALCTGLLDITQMHKVNTMTANSTFVSDILPIILNSAGIQNVSACKQSACLSNMEKLKINAL